MTSPGEGTYRSVILTGGTSGIGRAAAGLFAADGWRVYELSRREAPSSAAVRHICCDVSDETSVRAAVDAVLAVEGRVDALVNNAGIGVFGETWECTEEALRREFEVNYFGAVRLTRLVLPSMLENGRGTIVNVASMAAFLPLPYQAGYSASKAALVSWTRALAGELRGSGVAVSAVCPGDVSTGFTAARCVNAAPERTDRVARALAKAERSERGGQSPEAVAREIVRFAGSRRPPLVAIPGLRYAWLDRLSRLLPRSWVSSLVGRIYT